ncbi:MULTISPECIES: hypothetical protein [Paenibacillus]|uniref:PEP-utilising enzyme C-terminal domain-containing protein n=1 Tax=Paenibacillus odorifer TaxID=189426 RepID=A0ABX3H9P8_9BACL|nr:hypothetical protein [Paenibacillus odorifer]OMD47199.1 hypothetical protein BSK51_25465 [Paenibacillus odorifer]
MKGERQQDGFRSSEERPFKFMYKAGDRAVGMEMSQAGSVASAAAEFITGVEQKDVVEPLNRSYFKRPGEQSAFLVLREGREEREERPTTREGTRSVQAGPCLIRSEEWLLEPELFCLYENWLSSEDELQANRMLQRIYYRLQAAITALLESPDGEWAAITLLHPEELAAQPAKLTTLQDAQLEALFTAVAESQRQGGDCRLDLLVAYTASGAEFAAKREFIEVVADQTLGHAYAAACRIGALIAPDVEPSAAAEIARIADFLVLDGAASELAPEGAAAEGFTLAAGEILAAVRSVKPSAVVLAAGTPAASALADLYQIGLSGIFCSAGQRTEALLRAACLIWIARQQETLDTAAGGRQ